MNPYTNFLKRYCTETIFVLTGHKYKTYAWNNGHTDNSLFVCLFGS